MKATDYLVVGCGASAMAFIDTMLKESDATFTVIDRRHMPGGHWNDAYPFVHLHQPSAYYGVASRNLGRGRIDKTGFNAGFHELASGIEVTHYFHSLMQEDFLPSGRVEYFPLCDYRGDGEFVSLLSGERHRRTINKKLVDATLLHTNIPLTHTPQFSVADGVVCIPPNHLPRLASNHQQFTILGSGKTGIDSLTWLLENGVPPETITWVMPRDPWLWNRRITQPGLDFFNDALGGIAKQYEVIAKAESVRALCEGMEANGTWLRLDPNVWPSMYHGATITEKDLEQLRRIKNIIRLGRVKNIELDKIILDKGEAASGSDRLYIDCTARALPKPVDKNLPVFGDKIISLQMVRNFQPCFSAAMIGHLEATLNSEEEKQALSSVTAMSDTVEDWIEAEAVSMINQNNWNNHDATKRWLRQCRLNGFASTIAQVKEDDHDKLAILGSLSEFAFPAVKNLSRLAKQN